MCDLKKTKQSKYVKLIDEQIYETKSVKVIVRIFEQDMILLVVMRKSKLVNENTTYNYNSQSAYFSAHKGNTWYVYSRNSLLNFKRATTWFRNLMKKRFPDFFDPNMDYEDHSEDQYIALSHNRKCIGTINKWYEHSEYKILLQLFPDVDPTIHNYCNIEYSFPWPEFHISTADLPNPHKLPHPESKYLPHNQLTISYPIKISDQRKIIDYFRKVDEKAYQILLQIIANKDVFIELFVGWIKDYRFRAVCQVFCDEGDKNTSLIGDKIFEDTCGFNN